MIDFEVYKNCLGNIVRMTRLIIVLIVALFLYLLLLPLIWLKPIQMLFGPLERLISDLT